MSLVKISFSFTFFSISLFFDMGIEPDEFADKFDPGVPGVHGDTGDSELSGG
jgi:hypothetical protein